ncbi:MAG: glycoside hydrolase family 57 protein [Chloroflexota bacterium]
MTAIGAFTFVLHSHLPYARKAGMWPHGEEWVHEAIAETYLPILRALDELTSEGVDWRLTIGITPILAEQIADPEVRANFITYASERAAWAAADIERFEAAGDQQMAALARHEHEWYTRALTDFRDRYDGDLIGAFRNLREAGRLDIATCAATHGFLPLLSRDSSIHGQLHTGVRTSSRHFGHAPTAIWLPECAYRGAAPAQELGRTVRRPGLETFLAEEGLEVFFSETHTVEGGDALGSADGAPRGPSGQARGRLTPRPAGAPRETGTTFRPYWVGDAPGEVAVLARNPRTGQQVWSATFGYPGDHWYREFHKKDTTSGMHYWRVGGRELDMGQKPPYDPARAQERVRDHAAHYVWLVEDVLGNYTASEGTFGVISAAYDTELFGHWWFEGVDWLKEVLRGLASSPLVELSTASAIIERHPPDRVLSLPETSWGNNGDFSTWMNHDTEWMWPLIHGAEARMERLVAANPAATGARERLLNQTARELLLLQSSDWPFLVTTLQAKEYAIERFTSHLERFTQLADMAETGEELHEGRLAYLAGIEHLDNPFPDIDYRDWANRQGETPPPRGAGS